MITGWAAIQATLSTSQLTVTTPVDDPRAIRALVPATVREVQSERSQFRASNRFVVTADVSQWYPSTYTHSFTWALDGKLATKAAIAAGRGGRRLGDRLDRAVQRAQSNQTIGMPIGPDTSFVLGELILSQCDAALLTKSAKRWLMGFRYYDDYELYVRTSGEADKALAALENALGEYELSLNPYKVEVLPLPQALEDEWVSALKRIDLRANAGQERTDLTLLFDEAFRLRSRYPNDHVLAYALGRFVDRYGVEGHRVKPANWAHLERLLLQASLAEPGVLQKAVHVIYWAKQRGWPINKPLLTNALTSLVVTEAARGHASEVAWALWAAIVLGVRVRAQAARLVSNSNDDIVALVALHARDVGAIGAGLDVREWAKVVSANELWGAHWLLAYEAYEHGWLAGPVDHIAADPAFLHLRTGNVRFYDAAKALPAALAKSPTVVLAPPFTGAGDPMPTVPTPYGTKP